MNLFVCSKLEKPVAKLVLSARGTCTQGGGGASRGEQRRGVPSPTHFISASRKTLLPCFDQRSIVVL